MPSLQDFQDTQDIPKMQIKKQNELEEDSNQFNDRSKWRIYEGFLTQITAKI